MILEPYHLAFEFRLRRPENRGVEYLRDWAAVRAYPMISEHSDTAVDWSQEAQQTRMVEYARKKTFLTHMDLNLSTAF